jgi:hypothetical protein
VTTPGDDDRLSANDRKLKSYKEISRRPVLEPSSFPDDGKGGWTLVRRRGQAPAITGHGDAQIHDRPAVSNVRAYGPQMRNAGGPLAAEPSPKPCRDRMSRHQPSKVTIIPTPNLVAGRAFRHLLGYTWRRKTLVAPVAT